MWCATTLTSVSATSMAARGRRPKALGMPVATFSRSRYEQKPGKWEIVQQHLDTFHKGLSIPSSCLKQME